MKRYSFILILQKDKIRLNHFLQRIILVNNYKSKNV